VLHELGVEPGDGTEPVVLKGVIEGSPKWRSFSFFGADAPASAEGAEKIRIVNKTNSLFMLYLS